MTEKFRSSAGSEGDAYYTMPATPLFTFKIEKVVSRAGFYWVIFKRYQEKQRSDEIFATVQEAEAAARAKIAARIEEREDK
jgi:hypothetical protein